MFTRFTSEMGGYTLPFAGRFRQKEILLQTDGSRRLKDPSGDEVSEEKVVSKETDGRFSEDEANMAKTDGVLNEDDKENVGQYEFKR